MSARRYLKGGLLLSGGSVLSAACSFARNIIIARLISVEDFGIAATFAMTMSLIEMASNLALDRLLVQAPDGHAPRMLATAHAFQVFRGVLSAIALFALAGPVAALFDIPEVVWTFQLIAMVPLIRSFTHLDAACQQREMRFGASVWLDTVPQVVTTLAAAPLALWLGDYRVMLVIVLGQVAMMTLVSHLVAERPYRWAWDRQIIGRMLRFGWPLLIDGVLIFATFHGEKVIVGSAFEMEQLGWYCAALTIVMPPSLLLSNVLTKVLLPTLARSQDHAGQFARKYAFTAQLCLLVGSVYICGLLIAGDELLVFAFGDKYALGGTVLPWLALAFGLRIFRIAQALAAVAKADTRMALYMNAIRSVSVLLALVCVELELGIVYIALSALVGELASIVGAQLLIRFRMGLHRSGLMLPFVLAAIIILVLATLASQIPANNGTQKILPIGASVLGSAVLSVALYASCREIRRNAPIRSIMLWMVRPHAIQRDADKATTPSRNRCYESG